MKIVILIIILITIACTYAFLYAKYQVKFMKIFYKSKRIILVGNGPSVMETPLGKKIDEFDVVVRFNDFRIFEKYTGCKTSVHVRTFWMMNRSFVKDASRLIVPIVPIMGCIDLTWLNLLGINTIPYRVVRIASKYLSKKIIPTSGLLVLLYFIFEVKVKNITVIGFDGFNPQSTYNKSHYFESKNAMDMKYFGMHHCNEKNIFLRLQKKYNIKNLRTKSTRRSDKNDFIGKIG